MGTFIFLDGSLMSVVPLRVSFTVTVEIFTFYSQLGFYGTFFHQDEGETFISVVEGVLVKVGDF